MRTRTLIALLLLLPALPVRAEEAPLATYTVRHDHKIGTGDGELRILPSGIEYVGKSEKESEHSRVWRDDEIERIEVSAGKVEVFAYRGGRQEFDLVEGEVTPEVVANLVARFHRPIGTTVLPEAGVESGALLFEIPVFHRHVRGGESGTLRVYDGYVVFAAEDAGHSRFWRYSDIRDIGRLGRYGFEIATYEAKFATDGKSYIFDLKRPMTDGEYDALWRKLYAHE